MTSSAYNKLEIIFKKLSILDDISSLIHWDMEVMMPASALSMHTNKLQLIDKMHSNVIKNKKILDLITDAKGAELTNWQHANLKLMEKTYLIHNAIPNKLNNEFIKATTHCNAVWREARPNDDYNSFATTLKPVLNLVREISQIKGSILQVPPYDALLDQFDPGRRSYELDALFSAIQGKIQHLIQQRISSQPKKPDLNGDYPIELQKALGAECMQNMGFDFTRGRLDVSTHPFCTGSLNDIRLTTRYTSTDFMSALTGILHETGHALYEMNLPEKWSTQLVGKSLGMTIHESQSHFVEMQLLPTKEFMQFLQPKLQRYFPTHHFSAEDLLSYITHVEPSLIRVHSDELTYPLHIILRYQLEKLMIEGQLQVEDLPQAWNEGMHRLLGITPSNNKDGCMQDIHWPTGGFGYFPSYTLGSMTAAQLAFKCRQDIPSYNKELADGNFQPIFSWLKTNVHQHGSFHASADKLLTHATGENINPKYYLDYLYQKYGA